MSYCVAENWNDFNFFEDLTSYLQENSLLTRLRKHVLLDEVA